MSDDGEVGENELYSLNAVKLTLRFPLPHRTDTSRRRRVRRTVPGHLEHLLELALDTLLCVHRNECL